MKCEICGGTKRVINPANGHWVSCPKCCSAVEEAKIAANEKIETNQSSLLDDLKIPSIYQKMKYDSSILFYNKSASAYSADSIKSSVTVCDAIYHKVYSNELFMQSVYIHFPPALDGNLWVYSLQKVALERGISTLPYITLNELNRVIYAVDDNDLYDQYRRTKLCILDASARTLPDAWVTLADLLAVRARNDLPTIVTGYWSSVTLSSRDNGGAKYLFDDTAERLNILKPYDLLSRNSRAKVFKREQPNVDSDYYKLLGIGDDNNVADNSKN